MKIIKIDNLDRERIFHVLIATNVSEYYAKFIAAMLNRELSGTYSPNPYKAVEDDYKLMEEIRND